MHTNPDPSEVPRCRVPGIVGLCLALILYFLFSACVLYADPYAIPGTQVRVLPPSPNGQNYVLYVSLPAEYAVSPDKQYPVIYACDGYWDFPLLNAEIGNLVYDKAMPDAILVGIAYSGANPNVGALRQLDLTPWTASVDSTTGGAQWFLEVLATQIIPYVETQYRVDNRFRVLTGSSFGGLFVVYSLFQKPGLFQGYIAPSPSLWWNGRYMQTVARQYVASGKALPARLYLTWGSEEDYSIQSTTYELYTFLKGAAVPSLSVAARPVLGERHSGPKGESFNRGLRYVFAQKAPLPPSTVDPGFVLPSALANLSTRGQVGAGERQLIGGISIQGNEPKRVLVRAVGPGLKSFGLSNPLKDPKFTIFDNKQVKITGNDNWGDNADTATISTLAIQYGAFSLEWGSKDAACVVTLQPGLYTVVVESVDGSEGVALVECYEVSP